MGLWYQRPVHVGFILKPDKTEAGVLLEDLVPFTAATAQLKQVAPWSYFLQTLLDRERLVLLGSQEHSRI